MCYRYRRWADIEAINPNVRSLLRSQKAQDTVSCSQLKDRRVLSQSSQELISEHRDMLDHGWPKCIDENGSPHVRHGIALILVNPGHDFRHAFRSVLARTLVNLLRLSDADAIPRIPACCIVEYLLPVGCLRPACQRIQQPRAELLVRLESRPCADRERLCFPIQGPQK